MALTREQMGIVAQGKKWLVSVLDPQIPVKISELENQVQSLTAGSVELSKCNRMLTEAVIKDVGSHIQINIIADTIILGSNNSVEAEKRVIQAQSAMPIESVETVQQVNDFSGSLPFSPHTFFENDEEEIERLRSRYPGRRSEQ